MLVRNWLPRPSPFDAPLPDRRYRQIPWSWEVYAAVLRFQPVDPGEGQALVRRPCSARWCRMESWYFNTGFGQRVEQGRFPDVGQTDDTAFESHDLNHLNILIINLLLLTDCRNGNNFAYYTRHSAKMPQTTTYCALKACNRFVALVKPSVNHISVQRAASSMASSINFCSLTGGLPNTKPTTLFLSPG